MRISDTSRITIIGAGMSGALLATLFARRGFEVDLYEQHGDPRLQEPRSLQSVDLTLGERARYTLAMSGLLEQVDALCTCVHGRLIHYRSGATRLQPYGTSDDDALYSVRRDRLRKCLLDAAQGSDKVRIHFNHALQDIDWENDEIIFTTGGGDMRRPFEVLIGADGPVSSTRRALQQVTAVEPRESLLDSGYKAFSIPADENGGFRMDPDVLHVWPRGGYMLIAFPDIEGSFSVLLFLPRTGDHRMIWGFEQLDSWVRQKAFMQANFPDAVTLIPNLEAEFRDNPVGLMGSVRCSQWHFGGRALLIGDAAHTFVPFHGQGVNAAFEDCSALLELLDAGDGDWEGVFSELQQQRKANTDVLSDMSMDAYQTMRESVRHRDFLLRKALERELERRHPDRFVARYSLVMFHRISYMEAFERGKIQSGILDELLSEKNSLAEIDMSRASRLVSERLAELRAS